jgi:hypothetical protein
MVDAATRLHQNELRIFRASAHLEEGDDGSDVAVSVDVSEV